MNCKWLSGNRAILQRRSITQDGFPWKGSEGGPCFPHFVLLFLYLQWVFGADSQHLVFEVAEFAAPGASLADPANQAGLMGAAH